MNCQSCDLNIDHTGFTRCPSEATVWLWCPTWINAGEGPMALCGRHADNFNPKINPHASSGEFHRGDFAFDAFQQWQDTRKGVAR